MAYKCLFMDNAIYTAQDVNNAISGIVSDGVSGYPFGGDALSDLNGAIEELVDSGVQFIGDNCLVVNDNGTYKIQEGTCFMGDGSQIIFDSEGYVINHNAATHEYVYLERDVLHNAINVVVSDTSGANGTVLLAEIEQDGSISDRRRFAKSKVSLAAEPRNMGVVRTLQFTLKSGKSYSYDFGFDGWKYIIYKCEEGGHIIKRADEIADGETKTSIHPVENITPYSEYTYVRMRRDGSVLTFFPSSSSSNVTTNYNIEVEVR